MKAITIPLFIAASSLSVSCVRQVRTVSGLPPMPNVQSSAKKPSAMERQVQNAMLAQNGDSDGNPNFYDTYALNGNAAWTNYSVEGQGYSGGAPLGREMAEWYANIGIRIHEGYGLTETSPVIAVNTPVNHRIGTVGKTLPNLDLQTL